MKHKCRITRVNVSPYEGMPPSWYWMIEGECGFTTFSKRWDWALNKALDHLEKPRITLDHYPMLQAKYSIKPSPTPCGRKHCSVCGT